MAKKIDDALFVKVWTKCNSVDEVAETLDMTKIAATAKAAGLRKAGVNLKKFPKGKKAGEGIDVDFLNSLINGSDAGEDAATTQADDAGDDAPVTPIGKAKGKRFK